MMLEKRDYAQAQVCLEEALSKAQALEDSWALAFVLRALGGLALFQQDAHRAITLLEEDLAVCRAMGDATHEY